MLGGWGIRGPRLTWCRRGSSASMISSASNSSMNRRTSSSPERTGTTGSRVDLARPRGARSATRVRARHRSQRLGGDPAMVILLGLALQKRGARPGKATVSRARDGNWTGIGQQRSEHRVALPDELDHGGPSRRDGVEVEWSAARRVLRGARSGRCAARARRRSGRAGSRSLVAALRRRADPARRPPRRPSGAGAGDGGAAPGAERDWGRWGAGGASEAVAAPRIGLEPLDPGEQRGASRDRPPARRP